ncbi:MAG TPA: ATP-binding protein [Thermoanaerobaculia bacterium]|nr:ATP-binding protein [Thermoanaerobaculia bacterium]
METTDKVNVLLVDDEPRNLLAVESILASDDLEIVKAESGRQALRHLLDREFAVVLLDVQMPDLDGFETAGLIRERQRSRHTPIIFLTAISRGDMHVFRGYELGAVDYIFKPFQPEILRSKVNVFVQLFRNREELRRQAQELARLSRQNELILDAVVEGVVGIDLGGRVTFANPAAARMLQFGAVQMTGRDIHSIVHPRFPGVLTCSNGTCSVRSLTGGSFWLTDLESTFFRADGRSFPVEFCASPMYDDEMRAIGSVVTFRDVSEKRAAAAAAAAERRYREAEAENRAKDHFLATLSHELRTPMTSILGWVQFLRSGHFDEEDLKEALTTIEASARLQSHLIDDMLDVSRIVLGKFQVDLEPTSLTEIVEAALTTARPAAAERGVNLNAWIDRSAEDLVRADANRMQQVIGNILSNAIKFTPSGKNVELRLEKSDSHLRIRVTDEGEGIDRAFLPYVFDRLRQGENATKRTGLGLGLAIARHIVELHNGQITAESEGPGQGSTFTVTLPLVDGVRSPMFPGS